MSETGQHFDLCIIGSGSGLTLIDDDLNDWSIAIIDNGTGITNAFGGTCLNAGCIPTKMFALPSRYAQAPGQARCVNTDLTFNGIDFPSLQNRIFSRTDAISESGLAGLVKRPNVTVFHGDASFVDAHTIRVPGHEITADNIVLAAGSRPRQLDPSVLDDSYLQGFIHTSESIMRIERLPKHLVILGGGIEALEFSQIFSALGCQVAVIARGEMLIRHHDEDVAAVITDATSRTRNLMVRLNQTVSSIEVDDEGGAVVMTTDPTGMEYSYNADAILLTLGRIPNGDQLRLDKAGITLDGNGFVPVDKHQRTEVDHIWALGDICSPEMLKHLANAQARVVKRNLLAIKAGKEPDAVASATQLPYAIFGNPEIAGVGATEQQLRADGIPYRAHIQPFWSVAYGWALGEPQESFVKVLVDPDTKQLLGAHIIGEQAATLIQPLVMAMQWQIPLDEFARGQFWIHPALTEVIENACLNALAD